MQVPDWDVFEHSSTWICSRSPQYASVLPIWICSSSPIPTKASDTTKVTTSDNVIETLRLSPAASSERTCEKAMSPQSALVAVDAADLVTDDLAVVELDDAFAHLVDDAGVVAGHDDGRAGAVDP